MNYHRWVSARTRILANTIRGDSCSHLLGDLRFLLFILLIICERLRMLARYQMCRGHSPTVQGIRQDTRKHTKHCLRPDEQMVTEYLNRVTPEAWLRFAAAYQALIATRFAADRQPFDALAELASRQDVYLGCSCPTEKNPDVRHCHTMLALEFMQMHYPALDVKFPE